MVAYAYNYLLVSTWINSMLYTLELVLAVRYFQHSSRSLLHRVGIGAILASDTLCTFAIWAKLYMLVSLFPCKPPQVFQDFGMGTLAITLFCTHTTASIAQLFLCSLYYRLTLRRVISAVLLFSILVHFVPGYASAVVVVTTGSPLGWARINAKISFISCAITDSMIAAALLYTFIRMDAAAFRGSTHNLLRRLIALFLSSGLMVASTTLLSLILTLEGQSAYSLFFFSQGRVYAITILGNFAVGVPAQHTPTITTTVTTLTVEFNSNSASANEGGISACDPRRTTLLPNNSNSDTTRSFG